MAARPDVSYDGIFRIAMVAGVAFFIFSLVYALYADAHGRGLAEPFQWVFYAAGFTIFIILLPRLLRRGGLDGLEGTR